MDIINFKKLHRNPYKIKQSLVEKEGRTIAKDSLSILIPSFYFKKNLAKKTNKNIELVCVFPILDDKGSYGVIADAGMQVINYGRYSEVTVDDEVYEMYTYLPGDVVMNTVDTVKSDQILFAMFDAFFMLGKIPSFMEYLDISNLFLHAKKYTGSRIGDFPVILDLMISSICRSGDDVTVNYKDVLHTFHDLRKPIAYIGLTDTGTAISNNGSRMISGYFDKNMINAVLNEERKVVKDIDVLRR